MPRPRPRKRARGRDKGPYTYHQGTAKGWEKADWTTNKGDFRRWCRWASDKFKVFQSREDKPWVYGACLNPDENTEDMCEWKIAK